MEENKDMNTEKEIVEKTDFADVNYGKENEEKKPETVKAEEAPEKNKNGIKIAALIAAVAALVIAMAMLFMNVGKKHEAGLANRYGMVIGIVEGDALYHSDFYGENIYKTILAGESYGEKTVVKNTTPWSFTRHNGKIYYYDRTANKMYELNDAGEDVLIFEGLSYYHQFEGDYIYYMEPTASYGGVIKRVPIKGGEAELVLNVNTSCFAVSGRKIIYYDPSINSLLETTLSNAMSFAKASDGKTSTSAEIKALVLAKRSAGNINIVGNDVYFIDSSASNVICCANMKSGEVKEINFGATGTFLNVYDKYIFYVGSDNALYRMNLDGKDIRNLTGSAFKEFAGFGLFEDCIVAYALMPQLNSETMQTEYMPVIVVMDFEGTPKAVIPAIDSSLAAMDQYMEIPEITEEEVEAPEETEG